MSASKIFANFATTRWTQARGFLLFPPFHPPVASKARRQGEASALPRPISMRQHGSEDSLAAVRLWRLGAARAPAGRLLRVRASFDPDPFRLQRP